MAGVYLSAELQMPIVNLQSLVQNYNWLVWNSDPNCNNKNL